MIGVLYAILSVRYYFSPVGWISGVGFRVFEYPPLTINSCVQLSFSCLLAPTRANSEQFSSRNQEIPKKTYPVRSSPLYDVDAIPSTTAFWINTRSRLSRLVHATARVHAPVSLTPTQPPHPASTEIATLTDLRSPS